MAPPDTQNLARQLIASQAAHDNAAASLDAAAQVVGELRLRLIKLAGVDGFRSLLARALALAKIEAPSLRDVQVKDDGTLAGFNELESSAATEEAGTVLVAFLLQLLVTFIGEPLTLRLVRDAFPNFSPDTSPHSSTNALHSSPNSSLHASQSNSEETL